jgi:hypothetical protein
MISPKYLDVIQLDKVTSGLETLPDGLYCTVFKEEEDSGWINYTSYRYYRSGFSRPIWTLDISGKDAFVSILFGKSVQKSANKEEFLDHIRQFSPEVMDWVLFNLESITSIRL